jgi:hypothetical protein
MSLLAPDRAYLWCHRCKSELLHTANINAYVCDTCNNRKQLAEVLATYCTWDDYDVPQVLMLPERLLLTADRAFRYRQLWLNEPNTDNNTSLTDTIMREVFTLESED